MKIRKGDKVKIIRGKDKNKEGLVERVFTKEGKIIVAGLNIYKRHQKPKRTDQKGAIIDVARPLPLTNAKLICPKCQQPTRVGFRILSKEKTRICRKCKAEI